MYISALHNDTLLGRFNSSGVGGAHYCGKGLILLRGLAAGSFRDSQVCGFWVLKVTVPVQISQQHCKDLNNPGTHE